MSLFAAFETLAALAPTAPPIGQVQRPPIDPQLYRQEQAFRTALGLKKGQSPELTEAEKAIALQFAKSHPDEFVDVLRDARGKKFVNRAVEAALVVATDRETLDRFGNGSRVRRESLEIASEISSVPEVRESVAKAAFALANTGQLGLDDHDRLALLNTAHGATNSSELKAKIATLCSEFGRFSAGYDTQKGFLGLAMRITQDVALLKTAAHPVQKQPARRSTFNDAAGPT